MSSVEQVILANLCVNEDFARKVIPYLEKTYFSDNIERIIFNIIVEHINKFNTLPTKTVIMLALSEYPKFDENQFAQAKEAVNELDFVTTYDMSWLLEITEKFCKDRALYNAISESVRIIDGENNKLGRDAIPLLLQDALAVTFDTRVGHDYFDDAELRYDFIHEEQNVMPYSLDILNEITNGGMRQKTLNAVMAPSGQGKSIFLCNEAAHKLLMGKNVLYITCEMAEERIAERIDANLLDITMDAAYSLPKDIYLKRLAFLKDKTLGKLKIKEYPTGTCTAANVRHLLRELKTKSNFDPDLIIIDYINICDSVRYKGSTGVNSYTRVLATAEEFRGLMIEMCKTGLTATQTTRSGFTDSDIDITKTAESIGLVYTLDFFFCLIPSEALAENDQILGKQLKNRYGDENYKKRFVLGLHKAKMKFFDPDKDNTPFVANEKNTEDKPKFGKFTMTSEDKKSKLGSFK